jgi:methylated-DNA-[protein]-cysteine S-methyltransferase
MKTKTQPALQRNRAVTHAYKIIQSPVGDLRLVANDEALIAVNWENGKSKGARFGTLVENDNHPVILETERQLKEYFGGKRKTFSLKLELIGTQFQKDVWQMLLTIPFGETRSYGELARRLGNPRATRAVGAANGRNPIPIVVPCHRVIGASGKLTGFGGGLHVKAQLLELEGDKTLLTNAG